MPFEHHFVINPNIRRSPLKIARSSVHILRVALPAIAGMAAISGALYLAIYVVPNVLVTANAESLSQAELLKARNDLRGTLIQALAAIAVTLGLFYTARTYRMGKEANVSDRFASAVSQLDNQDVSVRTGALISLYRVAIDSHRDQHEIEDLLVMYVRDRVSTRDVNTESGLDENLVIQLDVQAAITLLGKRPRPHRSRKRIVFDQLDLRGYNFSDGNWSHASFCYASLDGAIFANSNCRRAVFTYASARRSIFTRSALFNVQMTYADLRESYFGGVKMRLALLRGADFRGVDFTDISKTALFWADFEDTRLDDACFTAGSLSRASNLDESQLAAMAKSTLKGAEGDGGAN